MTHNTLRRVAIFYDGSFFQYFNNWCKAEFECYVDFRGMHRYLIYWLSKEEGHKNPDLFRIVEAHYFQGRFTPKVATEHGKENNKDYLSIERIIDLVLMEANITTHYYPIRQDLYDQIRRGREKGIDVWLSLEAYDLAVHKRFDYFILFSGDEDFVPLIRKINGLGITTVIIVVDINTRNQKTGEPIVIRTSQKLTEEASKRIYIIDAMSSIDNNKKSNDEETNKIKEILYQPSKS